MLHSCYNNTKFKHLHERCLRLTYYEKILSYEELLEKNWVSLYPLYKHTKCCNRNV